MLSHAYLFLALAAVAAVLAFSGLLVTGVAITKVSFYLFLGLGLLSLAAPKKVF